MPTGGFKCDVCGSYLSSHNALLRHKQAYHGRLTGNEEAPRRESETDTETPIYVDLIADSISGSQGSPEPRESWEGGGGSFDGGGSSDSYDGGSDSSSDSGSDSGSGDY